MSLRLLRFLSSSVFFPVHTVKFDSWKNQKTLKILNCEVWFITQSQTLFLLKWSCSSLALLTTLKWTSFNKVWLIIKRCLWHLGAKLSGVNCRVSNTWQHRNIFSLGFVNNYYKKNSRFRLNCPKGKRFVFCFFSTLKGIIKSQITKQAYVCICTSIRMRKHLHVMHKIFKPPKQK